MTPPSSPTDEPWPDHGVPTVRHQTTPDSTLALDALDDAIAVAFLAVTTAEDAAQAVPQTVLPARVRADWRAANGLVRQALRLIDERRQDLDAAIPRPDGRR